ncbi:hypothetical protein D5086_003123 [Populus alba]|uniref:Uncharacterized protein n=1 Tax=Populus alba TaxID=43335 RepID=A0ACC4D3V9_POPAL
MYNLGRAGLTYWSPNINVVRDPRRGRLQRHQEKTLLWLLCAPTTVLMAFLATCADPRLLKGTIRGEWDLHGYIVSDCDSIQVMVDNHKWLGDTKEDVVAQVLKAGKHTIPEAAREGAVLLKNINESLPLDSAKFKNIAVIGPHANSTAAMVGNCAGVPCRYVTPLDGISSFGEVIYEMGCGEMACRNDSLFFPAMEAAKKADATLLLVGLDLSIEAESLDREDLLLPGYQTQLINQVAQVYRGPVILIIMSAGGRGIADVVFGKYNPKGRLPLTWYESSYVDMLPMTSMPLRPVDSFSYPGRTYKFYNGAAVYPFGYGLSYTEFGNELASPAEAYLEIKLNKHQQCHDLNHTSEGYSQRDKDGSEVVMVYSKPPDGVSGAHAKQVIGFERVFAAAGKSNKVRFSFNACKSLAIVDTTGYKVFPSDVHKITVGYGGLLFFVRVSFNH